MTASEVAPPPVAPSEPRISRSTPRQWLLLAACLGSTAVSLAGIFTAESPRVVGLWSIVLLLVLTLMKVPVGVSLALPGILGLYAIVGERAAIGALAKAPYDNVTSWSLTVIPMFVLMGMLLTFSGIATKVYDAAKQWLGWLPGGLAIGTNAAGAGLSAVTGSTIGSTYALGRTGIPEMLRAGYDKKLTVGAIMVAGLSGQLIPPSILMVVYAGIAEVPVGPALMAGVVPGVIIAVMCCVVIWAVSVLRPELAGRGSNATPSTWGQRWASLLATWPVFALMIIVLGGMSTGWLTATEAGAAGAFGSLIFSLYYLRRDRPWSAVRRAVVETAASVGAIFFVVIGAHVFATLLALSGLSAEFTTWIADLGISRVEFLLLMFVAYLVMGMFMDPLSIMLLTVPLLIPTLEALDISLFWYGVFAVLMGEIAIVTPPVGLLAFVLHGMTKDPEVNVGHDISLGDVFRSVLWYLPVVVAFVMVLIAWPELVTAIPDAMVNNP